MRNYKLLYLFILFYSLNTIQFGICEAKFIQTFIPRIGGNSLNSGDATKLAKFDIILCNKMHYNDDNGKYSNTWENIKSFNPNAKILLYTSAMYSNSEHDSWGDEAINGLDRFENDRNHPQGDLHRDIALHKNKKDWHLKTSAGNYVVHNARATDYLFDFGDMDYQLYACQATIDNYIKSFNGIARPWAADGVFTDHGWTMGISNSPDQPAKYSTDALWSAAMNNFNSSMAKCMHNAGQLWGVNAGPTYNKGGAHDPEWGSISWRKLDMKNPAPDLVIEELAFAYGYGAGDIFFMLESDWVRQVNLLRDISNMRVLFLSSSDLRSDVLSGIDNFGKPFTFWDSLWYCIGSYILGKNDIKENSYFSFIKGTSTYSNVNIYYDEYQKIELGKAVSNYKVTKYSETNIYWREFEDGYVYVNPTEREVTSITLEEPCKQLTHENLHYDSKGLPEVNIISLKGHRAAILIKSKVLYSKKVDAPINLHVKQN